MLPFRVSADIPVSLIPNKGSVSVSLFQEKVVWLLSLGGKGLAKSPKMCSRYILCHLQLETGLMAPRRIFKRFI